MSKTIYLLPCSAEEAFKEKVLDKVHVHNIHDLSIHQTLYEVKSLHNVLANGRLFDERSLVELMEDGTEEFFVTPDGKVGLLLDDYFDYYDEMTQFVFKDGTKAYRIHETEPDRYFWCKEVSGDIFKTVKMGEKK